MLLSSGLSCSHVRFAGALLGMRLGTALPEHWLAESSETVKVGIGLIATSQFTDSNT